MITFDGISIVLLLTLILLAVYIFYKCLPSDLCTDVYSDMFYGLVFML